MESSSTLLTVVYGLLCISQFTWAQSGAGLEEQCSMFSAEELPTCSPDIPATSWASCISATDISLTEVTLSWLPHPDIPPTMQESYEIYWRRRMPPDNLLNWNRSPRLNGTTYDTTTGQLTFVFDGLSRDRPYEMRVCRFPSPRPPLNGSASPACGHCTLHFETLAATCRPRADGRPRQCDIELISAILEILDDDTNILTCEASGDLTPSISWEVRQDGTRQVLPQLQLGEGAYTITDTTPGTDSIRSVLMYKPEEVDFARPECIIRIETQMMRVRNEDFMLVTEPPTQNFIVPVPIWAIVLLVVMPALVVGAIIITAVVCMWCYRYKKRKRNNALSLQTLPSINSPNEPNEYSFNSFLPPKKGLSIDSDTSVMFSGPLETSLPKDMIIPNSDVKVSTVIGQGEFGVVYKAHLQRSYNSYELVAVKTLKGIFATASDIQSFTEEILILQHFNHPNVMSLIGVCLGADKVGGGPSIILPFMSKGSLLNFLRKEADRLRPSKDADITQIGAVEKSLVQICLQVARGMEYLACQRFVHRDLAARNCMIDQNDQIKVGDFGLTEDIYAKNYFRQASSDGVKLPVKWMAPESLKLGVFSEKSDVWSYGVTCWEVFSCGEIPYPGIHPQQVLNLLEDGQRLGKPRNPACSDQMFTVLLSCWEAGPEKRKTFTELCTFMEGQLTTMSDYLDLNVIANTEFTDPSEDSAPYSLARDFTTVDEEGTVPDGGEPPSHVGITPLTSKTPVKHAKSVPTSVKEEDPANKWRNRQRKNSCPLPHDPLGECTCQDEVPPSLEEGEYFDEAFMEAAGVNKSSEALFSTIHEGTTL